jgi:AraC family transcriptional regulator
VRACSPSNLELHKSECCEKRDFHERDCSLLGVESFRLPFSDGEIWAMQPQFRSDDNRQIAVHAAVYESKEYRHNASGGDSAALSLNDVIGSLDPTCDNPLVAETLAFQHLHLVLAVAPQDPRERGTAESGAALNARCLPSEENDTFLTTATGAGGKAMWPTVERPEDPIIKRLSDALALTERTHDRYAAIQEDALRLAIAVRLLGLQSGAQRSARGDAGDRMPDTAPAERPVRALQKWRLKRVAEYIDNHLSAKVSLADLAAVARLSRMHFASQFRIATGLRPHEYLLRRRVHRADELLRNSSMTIVEIALAVGFQTQAHFTTVFKRIVGTTPHQWRNHHAAGQVSG